MTEQPKHYTYDDVPYPNLSHELTHPDRLATLAQLLGMTPAPVDNCRVLELGCAGGVNLLGMAYGLPGSTFFGLDNSAPHIQEATAVQERLGLTNVTFEQMDIMNVDASLGQFDYIIAHGVYSWVPPNVRKKVLEIARQNLAPQGVAYISYNTYPGWHTLGMMRDMMMYRTRNSPFAERMPQAFTLMQFMSETASDAQQGGAYKGIFEAYINTRPNQLTGWRGGAAFMHDELSPINDPCYFYEFIEQVEQHELQYLIEASFTSPILERLSPEAREFLNQITDDAMELEQYLDFLSNRTFRRTLLCHKEVELDRQITPDQITDLYLTSLAAPLKPDEDDPNPEVERFQAPDHATFATDHPLIRAGMHYLIETSPKVISFRELLTQVCARQGIETPPEEYAGILAAGILRAFTYSPLLVELHVQAPDFTTEISERPLASPLARLQALSSGTITNLRHESLKIEGVTHFLLPHLDGTHDRADLLKLVMKLAEEGKIVPIEDGESPADEQTLQAELEKELDETLRGMVRAALLIG